ncbi:MAG: O-acetyl-ADP-ribose deacetylase [Candidatus Krumholzibacteriota bacterium]|nr:O-acetyl-ADP-ribose deacetylase [Candidatus Krumholzibacteriota bacterium]
MVIRIVQGDITDEEVDAVVNAAKSSLSGGGGVDGAIHRAGGRAILAECLDIVEHRGPLPAGEAVSTTAGSLPAAHVIHTVGPVWRGGDTGEAETLARCYENSLAVAADLGLASVAFPAISTGIYGYPFADACRVSFAAVRDFCLRAAGSLREVRFVYFSPGDAETAAQILAETDALP